MTSKDLFEKMRPFDRHIYLAQYNSSGLDFNQSDLFSRLIKDAARCNGYNSDVFYDLKYIDERMKEFNPNEVFDPIWIGFRKLGVDNTDFVLCRCDDEYTYGSMSSNYFALYSITVENRNNNFYNVCLNEYNV